MYYNAVNGYKVNFIRSATAPNLQVKSREQSKARTKKGKPARRGRRLRSWLIILLLLLTVLVLSPFAIVQLINSTNQSRIYTSPAETPARPVAMVFGAGLLRDGSPSWMLADRLDSAISLYKSGKVERLLMTGDQVNSQEVNSMRNYAQRKGVPAAAIVGDNAGLRTYDSCFRAYHNFGVTRAVLVTQAYHLPRALYLCNSIGIDSVGLKAGRDNYPNQEYYNSREFLATFASWVDINITRPKPEIIS